ncbi:MAG TPA: tetratricopeptide repeat protein [Bryobacteraceae bacterium]|nr:tetratricopeptide repeat protein [Bryobacteraceae bacterium]
MRLLLGCAGILISLAAGSRAVATGPGNPSRFEELIQQGRAAFLASDADRAESAWKEACPSEVPAAFSITEAVTCANLLASVEEVRGNLARAEQLYRYAASLAEQTGKTYQPLYCARLIDLGEFYHRRGKPADAEDTLQTAVDLARRLAASVPDLLPKALIPLGSLYADSAHPERGRAPLTEAMEFAQLPAADIAAAQNALGKVELASGRPDTAEPYLREAVRFAETNLGEDHPATAAYETNLALALIAERKPDRAFLLLRRAEVILKSNNRAPGLELAVVCAELAGLAAGEGKLAEAEDYATRSLSILGVQPESHAIAAAAAKVMLASVYLRLHDLPAAESILPGAVEVERQTAINPQALAASLRLLAQLRTQQHDRKSAEALHREAANIKGLEGAPHGPKGS